jgi:ferredoxin
MHLLLAVPDKVKKTLDAMLSGRERRTGGRKSSARAWVTKMEKMGAHKFPETLVVAETCTGCGWCARNCPTGNITAAGSRPAFSQSCAMCYRCVYGCPAKALSSKSFMVLKRGFDLDTLQKRMQGVTLPPVKKCFRGLLWKSARDYLLDKDGY